MGIPHDDGEPGPDKSLFREDGMADPVAADVKEILDAVAAGPFPHDLPLGGGFGILGRGHMVDDRLDLVRVKDPVLSPGFQVQNGRGRGDFVAEYPV